jgi:hypothetical protein
MSLGVWGRRNRQLYSKREPASKSLGCERLARRECEVRDINRRIYTDQGMEHTFLYNACDGKLLPNRRDVVSDPKASICCLRAA